MIQKRLLQAVLLIFCLVTLSAQNGFAQQQGSSLPRSQQFRQADRIIRVAEPGQLADTLNVWGDVSSPGRYLIPKTATLPQLISYSFGPETLRDREANLDWSKMRVEINISEYDTEEGMEEVESFKYKFDEPLPQGMRKFNLKNDQVVAVQVKRKPAFIDYVKVIAPVISAIATSFLIVDRLR